jgi:tetratricopeptide (TPR) repeat protein
MKRKLNRKLFLWLVGVLAALGVGIHFLHGAQVRRSAEVLLEQANRAEQAAEEAKDPAVQAENRIRSRDYLERYLAIRPRDVPALLRLADLLEKQGNEGNLQAIRTLEKAIQADPERDDLRLRVAQLWLKLPQVSYSGVKPQIDWLVARKADQAEVQELAGRVEEGLGQFQQAAVHYNNARELEPDRIEVYSRLAELLRRRLNDAAQADAVMNANDPPTRPTPGGLIAANPKSAKAYLALAAYRERYGVQGPHDSVAQGIQSDVGRALKEAPQDVDVLLAAGLLEREGGALEAARAHLTEALRRDLTRPEIYQALADLEIKAAGEAANKAATTERMKAAATWLERGIQELPKAKALTLKLHLASTLARANRLDDAQKVIDELKAAGVRNELVQYLTGYVQMGKQEWKKALDQLKPAQLYLAARPDQRELNKRVLAMMGDCYAQLGDLNNRYDAFRRAAAIDLENDPLRVPARLGLASALQALGRIDQAVQEYALIAEHSPELRLSLAQLMTMQNLRLAPDKQRWPFVEKLLNQIDRDKPNLMQVAILRSEVLYAKKQVPQARALLEKARDTHPDRIEPWMALAGLADRQGEDSLAVLEAAEKAIGPHMTLYQARASYWARKKGPRAPEELVKLERVADTLEDAEQNRLWRDVSMAYAALGAYDRAHRLWRQLAERLPNDLAVQLTGFDLALQAGDAETARKGAERIRTLDGADGILTRYTEALLLGHRAVALPEGDPQRAEALSRARALLVQVAAAKPTWSRAAVAQAEVAVAQGLDDEAMRYYIRAIDELGDRSPGAMAAAAQVFYKNKRVAEADRMVRLMREQNVPISGELRRLVAEIAFQNRDYLRALEQAQQIVPDDSDDPDDLIWLGRLRWAAGRQAEAERALRRAVEKGPDRREPHLALIAYLALTGRKEQAIAALGDIEKRLPADQVALVLAEGNELVGRADVAREKYDQALRAQPTDLTTLKAVAAFCLRNGRIREATTHLRAIIDKHPTSPDARAARRTLVLATAASGNRQDALRALESLGLSDSPGGTEVPGTSSLDDLRTKAQVLAMQPNKLRRQEAINILNQVLAAERARADDLFLLGQLYEANGEWDQARATMHRLLEFAPEPTYLAAFARSLLRHDSLPEAEAYLTRLERVAPKQAATIEIKARVLHAQQQDAEATRLVRDFAASDPQYLLFGAQLLEELKQPVPAEELYREYVIRFEAKNAAAVLALAGFLSRQGRTTDALNLLDEKVWNRLPAEVASNASVVLLYGARAATAEYDRVDARVQKAINENPSTVSIQFDLANLRSLQGRYDEAAQIYRAIFQREKSRGAPLNNLAWMLALQGGKAAEAMEAITKAMELEGETPELLDTRALIYLAKNQPDEAIQDLENALVVQPKNAEMHFHLAQAYQLRGRAGEAAEMFNQAKTLGLTVEKLHPLERDRFTRMAGELAVNK